MHTAEITMKDNNAVTSQPGLFFRVMLICLVTFGLLLTSVGAQEAEPSSSTSYKIGVVDMSSLLKNNAKRKKRYEELQVEVDKRQAELDVSLAALEAKRKQWQAERATMTEDASLLMKNEIEEESTSYGSELKKHQRYIDNMEERVLREVLRDIESAIKQIAAKENFHLVLNAKSDPGRGFPYFSVLYHSPTIDITSKILDFLNIP